MKKLLFVCSFMLALQAMAQRTPAIRQAAWQQRVDYTIDVALNDVQHTLKAFESIRYTNHSPDTLKELYFHLWPNAYKNNQTAFAVQNLENGSTAFHFAPDEDRGYIDSLDFAVDGQKQQWALTANIDVCRIILAKPVLPGQSVTISTPFFVKIPKVFSRMGHENQLYCISQWYPKPAVYDVNGWNPMPYLDQGEFYSEYGKFDVRITLPENYVVAATGDLQNKTELDWLYNRSQRKFTRETGCSESFPESATKTKTLRYLQDSVHDFAWFCDKRFQVERSSVTLPKSGHKVTTWFFSVCPKSSSVHWMDTAINFYSRLVGEYPYNNASGVYTPLLAGGGMEYPTITNMSAVNRQVIVHEVGHNWFYGLLGSNERMYPWMDESINNYYETRSNYQKLIPQYRGDLRNLLSGDVTAVQDGDAFSLMELEYLYSARQNIDQKPFLPSADFTTINYGTIIYAKASLAFNHLQAYLGDSLFDAMMQAYYEKWKYRHPLPGDFMDHARSFTGKNLDWLFEGLMNTTDKFDVKVKAVKKEGNAYRLTLKNKSNIAAPFPVTGMKNGLEVRTLSYEGFAHDTSILFPAGEYDKIRVDAFERTVDVYRNNNTIRTSGLLKTWERPQFRFLGNFDNSYVNRVFYTPIYGVNIYNKSMLGLAVYNSLVPRKKLEYVFAPMYAFGTKDLAGYFGIERHFMTYGAIKNITIGINGARFASEYFLAPTTYEKLAPFIRFDLAKAHPRTSANQYIILRSVFVNEQARTSELFKGFDYNAFVYTNLSYTNERKRKVNPYSFHINYQYGYTNTSFQKITAEAEQFLTYNKPSKGFKIRFFGGAFLQKPTVFSDPNKDFVNERVALVGIGNTGQFDYQFDQSQFGRGEGAFSNSIFTHQLMYGGTQFSVIDPQVASKTDSWLASLNLSTTIPGIFPIRLYADLLYSNDKSNVSGVAVYTPTFYYTGGIRISVLDDLFRINFPIVASTNITDVWRGNNLPGASPRPYSERISFMLNLNKANMLKFVRSISF